MWVSLGWKWFYYPQTSLYLFPPQKYSAIIFLCCQGSLRVKRLRSNVFCCCDFIRSSVRLLMSVCLVLRKLRMCWKSNSRAERSDSYAQTLGVWMVVLLLSEICCETLGKSWHDFLHGFKKIRACVWFFFFLSLVARKLRDSMMCILCAVTT